MTDKAISPLRRRLIEDMTIRRLSPKTHYQYIRHVKKFADFLGRSADKATAEDVHRYQLWLASIRHAIHQRRVYQGAAGSRDRDQYGRTRALPRQYLCRALVVDREARMGLSAPSCQRHRAEAQPCRVL